MICAEACIQSSFAQLDKMYTTKAERLPRHLTATLLCYYSTAHGEIQVLCAIFFLLLHSSEFSKLQK